MHDLEKTNSCDTYT